MHRPILLSGPMGSGKTTLGRELTRGDPTTFADVDEEIARETGKDIATLFEERGEEGFRAVEERIAFACLQNAQFRVIALGGGTVLRRTFRHAALRRGFLVTLTAPPATLEERVRGTMRPLLAHAGVDAGEATLRHILAERASIYAECHATFETKGRSVEEVARDVRAAAARENVLVPLGRRSYLIDIVDGAPEAIGPTLRNENPTSTLVVTDENVHAAQGDYLARMLSVLSPTPELLVLPPGERHKSLASVTRIWDAALGANLDRGAMIVSVGGGVVSDMAGFAAATLLRGIRWMSVPSTLLAMVDASVGGKTGFDYAGGKNRIGAIHQPRAVLIDLSLLDTLDAREFRSGSAELLKMALLGGHDDLATFDAAVGQLLGRDRQTLHACITKAVSEKVRVVAEDEREEGDRIVLNLGHTFGHAIEAAGNYAIFLHGEAVGLGLLLEHAFGVRKGWTDADLVSQLTGSLRKLGLPTHIDADVRAAAGKLLGMDKKRTGGAIKLPLLESPGKVVVREVEIDELAREI